MQQHPIPQNVTSYEFHLIGNMTLKQFIELGIGVGVGIFFYATNLPDIIKWPIILFSLGLGAALAFMPFDGRPLDRMVFVFFRAVYTPTQFIWRKEPTVPAYFSFKPKKAVPQSQVEIERDKVKQNLNEYINSLPDDSDSSELDGQEKKFISSLNSLFDSTPAAKNVIDTGDTVNIKSSPKVRIRKLKAFSEISSQAKSTSLNFLTSNIAIPEAQPVKVSPSTNLHQNTQTETNTDPNYQPTSTAHAEPSKGATAHATHNKNLPFPTLPSTPNTIVGMILDSQGKIVENAIVEIRDKDHMPVRALKSNKLGQFFSATQLPDGTYELEAEKDGLKFDIVSLKLSHQIVPPIQINAKP